MSCRFALSAVVCLGVLAVSNADAQQLFPRIINGTPTSDYEAVGMVGDTIFGGYGSGTLISPFHVLTAAHVADFMLSPTIGTFEVGGEIYRTSQIFIHPDYDSDSLDNDLAILELADPVLDIAPAEIFTGIPVPGDLLVIVGFGGGGDASGGDGKYGVKHVATTAIETVTDTWIIWVFNQVDEGNTAAGDSGGPGFLNVAGQWQIASITSAGTTENSALGDIAYNTRVDAFADWINTILDSGVDDGGVDDGGVDDGGVDDGGVDDGGVDDGGVDDGGVDDGGVDDGGVDDGGVDDGGNAPHPCPGQRPGTGPAWHPAVGQHPGTGPARRPGLGHDWGTSPARRPGLGQHPGTGSARRPGMSPHPVQHPGISSAMRPTLGWLLSAGRQPSSFPRPPVGPSRPSVEVHQVGTLFHGVSSSLLHSDRGRSAAGSGHAMRSGR